MVLGLSLRLYLLIAAMFAVLYAAVVVLGSLAGITSFSVYLVFALVMILIQYLVGPAIVGWSMKVKYVTDKQEPELHRMITELAKKAGIPKPRVGISETAMPNAFAFGRTRKDGRVCVTRGILTLLDKDELRAVLGHEIAHIKNRDMAFITLLSVIPTLLWHLGWSMMWSRGRERGNAVFIGVIAFTLYFITNLLVLYGSRIREYYADKGSVEYGSDPHTLASALYKLTYGNAKVDKRVLRQAEGIKAFFVNDPSRAAKEFASLRDMDKDMSGTIDASELSHIRNASINLKFSDKMMEMFSTHPNMLKRIRHLSTLK